MNQVMIQRWNEVVKPQDTIFEMGDMFPFCKIHESRSILEQLNGNIISLKGNHFNRESIKEFPNIMFCDLLDIIVEDPEMSDGYQRISMCHYPMLSWNHAHKGSFMLNGHMHSVVHDNTCARLDVGVDGHNFYPWSYEEVKVQITKQLLKR